MVNTPSDWYFDLDALATARDRYTWWSLRHDPSYASQRRGHNFAPEISGENTRNLALNAYSCV